MARHEARVDIGSTRGWVADDEVDCLAPIEFFHRLGEGRTRDEQDKREDPSEAHRVQSKGPDLSWFENMADGRFIEIAGILTGHFCFPASGLDYTCASKLCAKYRVSFVITAC